MQEVFSPIPPGKVKLLPGMFQHRFDLNRNYVMSLRSQNLLQNHYLEAGLWSARSRPEDIHWGWESPTCQLRGHFLGHWLSAAARMYANTGDAQVKAKADHIVSELARCQEENGGEWAGPIPEKYLDWIARGKRVWAPHYTLHKTLMGLYEMAAHAGSEQALHVLTRWADWFYRWSGQFSRQEMDDILDVETGGMLEVWAELYGLTGREEHLELMRRYDRPRLFERLLAREDPLTNRHANTTIPEAHGAARAYEVTGGKRWRDIAEAYWRCAVADRGTFCTGSQTTGEVWTPPFEFSARLGDKNQEHCVVYNMSGLQYDAPGRLPVALDRGRGLRRLLGEEPVQRHPGPAERRDGDDRLLLATAGWLDQAVGHADGRLLVLSRFAGAGAHDVRRPRLLRG